MSPSSTLESSSIIIAAVEGGGSSFKVAVCRVDSPTSIPVILHRTEIPSNSDYPNKTLEECATFLRRHKPIQGYHALGVACFGPLGVHADRENYGCILATSPKAAWRNVNVLAPLRAACEQGHEDDEQKEEEGTATLLSHTRKLIVAVETDVNAPALAEYQAARLSQPSISSTAYITVGTGVGVGLVVNHECVHGRLHPEGGHVPVQPLEGDAFAGYSWGPDHCPFFGKHTVEGLACSVALAERLESMEQQPTRISSNDKADTLPPKAPAKYDLQSIADDHHEIWDHAANALANCCVTLILVTSVERIVLGGGILERSGLLQKIRNRTRYLMNGYVDLPADMSELIVTSEAGKDAGLVGAMVLARAALVQSQSGVLVHDEERKIKQIAFGEGMKHGIVVGAILAGLVCKYYFWPKRHRW